MAIDRKHIGRKYGPVTYELGVEKMREFAYAIGGGVPSPSFGTPPTDLNPVLVDPAAGAASRYGSMIAFPTFAVTFALVPFFRAVTDPELGINLKMLVHGEQELEFFEVMRPRDVLTTTGEITDLYEKAAKDFVLLRTESFNQHGKLVVRGTWMAVIRH